MHCDGWPTNLALRVGEIRLILQAGGDFRHLPLDQSAIPHTVVGFRMSAGVRKDAVSCAMGEDEVSAISKSHGVRVASEHGPELACFHALIRRDDVEVDGLAARPAEDHSASSVRKR